MSSAADAQSIDWSTMQRVDFDPDAPLALVDERAIPRRVMAVEHPNGTEALFGDEPPAPRVARARRPAAGPEPQPDTLF